MTFRALLAAIVNVRRPIRVLLPRVSETVPLHCLPLVGPQDSRTFVRRLRSTGSLPLEIFRLWSTPSPPGPPGFAAALPPPPPGPPGPPGPPEHAEVAHRVAHEGVPARPRPDALEAEAEYRCRRWRRRGRPCSRPTSGAPSGCRPRCPAAAVRRPSRRCRPRTRSRRRRAVLRDRRVVDEHAETVDREVLDVGDRDLDLLAGVGAEVEPPVLEAAGVARRARST